MGDVSIAERKPPHKQPEEDSERIHRDFRGGAHQSRATKREKAERAEYAAGKRK